MQSDPRLGTELAGHRIDAVIGRGAMAVVYLAHHLRLGRRVALKILDPALAEDEAFRGRFIRESQIAAGIDHPNIVTVYDAGEADGFLYVAMRYVEGTDLERLLEARGRVRPDIAAIIVSQSAAALDAAHAQGLVHGGVRPAAILLEHGRKASGRVFLSDFGITQHVAASTRLTRTGSFAGTVDYVAPEQIKGESEIDRRADVYALGCVLYRCLVGEPPFPRDSELVTIFAHLNDPPPRPSEHRAGLPPEIDPVIGCALAKTRDDRYDTCGDLARATRLALGGAAGPSAEPIVVGAPPRSSGTRTLRLVGAAGAAFILLVVGALMARSHDEGGDPTPPPSGAPPTVATSPPGRVVIAAAGEIACAQAPYVAADLDHCRYDSTARLLDPARLTAVLALGDNQYDSGTFNEYRAYYDPWWGKVKSITEPVPGDHEYNLNPSSNAHGYFAYWGSNARGHHDHGYQSFNLPFGCTAGQGVCWHLIALNSELCLLPGGCGPATPGAKPGPGNEMYRWLQRDLSTHANDRFACTLAFWHHPLFSFSTGNGSASEVQPLWDLLYGAGADVVLNSNSHNYQRWAPMDPTGAVDPGRGIREFVIGLGGVKKESLTSGSWPAGLAAAQDTSFGVLQMGLTNTGYTWEWVSADGQPAFSDSRAAAVECH